MTIESTNRDAWKIILSFLSVQEFQNLSLTCKLFLQKVRENQDIIAKQFHATMIKKQDIFLTDIYQNADYVMCILRSTYSSLNNQSSDLVKAYEIAKYSFRTLLSGIFGQEKSQQVVRVINEALIAPRLPPPKLKRESFDCETFSLYQTHLTDVQNGYDDESTINQGKMIDECHVLEFGVAIREKLASVNENHKMRILAARWYSTEMTGSDLILGAEEEVKSPQSADSRNLRSLTRKISKIAIEKSNSPLLRVNKKKAFNQKLALHNYMSQNADRKAEQEDSQFLVEMYKNIHDVFTSYCRIVFNGLENIRNPFLFLVEYTTKWKNYVVSMQSIGAYLREYSQLMNQVYEKLFQGYANYPEFRVWRMMVRIWYEEVFYKLENKISENYTKVLNSYLNIFSLGFRRNQHQFGNEDFQFSENIPSIFLESESDVSNVIGEFYQSIIDIALNERTIVTLTCQNLLNFGPTAGFCSKMFELIKERCNQIIQTSNLSIPNKSEILLNTYELIENFLPQHLFPQIYELIVGSLHSLLVEYLSYSTQAEGLKVFDLKESKLINGLNCEISELMNISYPSFKQHAQYCKKKLQQLHAVFSEREQKTAMNALKGFNLSVCDLEKTFMDFDRKVDFKVLEECRAMFAN